MFGWDYQTVQKNKTWIGMQKLSAKRTYGLGLGEKKTIKRLYVWLGFGSTKTQNQDDYVGGPNCSKGTLYGFGKIKIRMRFRTWFCWDLWRQIYEAKGHVGFLKYQYNPFMVFGL